MMIVRRKRSMVGGAEVAVTLLLTAFPRGYGTTVSRANGTFPLLHEVVARWLLHLAKQNPSLPMLSWTLLNRDRTAAGCYLCLLRFHLLMKAR